MTMPASSNCGARFPTPIRSAGEANWREVVVDDDTLHGEYIQSAPGTAVSRRFHPDTREFWAVVEGQLRDAVKVADGFDTLIVMSMHHG